MDVLSIVPDLNHRGFAIAIVAGVGGAIAKYLMALVNTSFENDSQSMFAKHAQKLRLRLLTIQIILGAVFAFFNTAILAGLQEILLTASGQPGSPGMFLLIGVGFYSGFLQADFFTTGGINTFKKS